MGRFRITLKPDAIKDLDTLHKFAATMVTDRIERHLRFAPARESRSRIKRLRGQQTADFRLRVGDYRVFYRIEGDEVLILRVMHKDETWQFYRGEES